MLCGTLYIAHLILVFSDVNHRAVVKKGLFRRIFDGRKHFIFDHEILMQMEEDAHARNSYNFYHSTPMYDLMISFDRI